MCAVRHSFLGLYGIEDGSEGLPKESRWLFRYGFRAFGSLDKPGRSLTMVML